jgi:hypothetical protein
VLAFILSFVPFNVKSVIPLPIFNLSPSPTCKILPELIVPISTLPLNVAILDTFNDYMYVVALFNVVF